MQLHPLSYRVDGKTFTGFLADGSKGNKAPGVLVAHEGGGFLTDHPKERARMIAQLGYVAFALDLFGDPRPTLDEAKAIVQQLRCWTQLHKSRNRWMEDPWVCLPCCRGSALISGDVRSVQ
jgi:dienelactone hydrolase